jgi:hypothetical protein
MTRLWDATFVVRNDFGWLGDAGKTGWSLSCYSYESELQAKN